MNETEKSRAQRSDGKSGSRSSGADGQTGRRKAQNLKSIRLSDSLLFRLLFKRLVLFITCTVLLLTATAYGIATWYQHNQAGKPYRMGVTFIPQYAQYLGVDPQETLGAILNDLGVRQFRLVSYWNTIETSPGVYDFSQLDWQFREIERVGGHVSLAMGLRQPRWPECHAPSFYDTKQPRSAWQPQLERYMQAVIERYKHSPALQSYQLENEYFNHFGECYNFDRERLREELALIHKLDRNHPIIISRSNNYAGYALREPLADINGISLYRRVWDAAVTKRYISYPFPSWHYASLAGVQKLLKGQESVIHELQAEPWPSHGKDIVSTSIAEQNKTFDAARLRSTVAFAKQTGIRQIDLWGAEYWYYRAKVLRDPSVWNEAKIIFKQ
ncbi:MAG: beta-galactosidase [Candidatus Saccharimonadales bacterium]